MNPRTHAHIHACMHEPGGICRALVLGAGTAGSCFCCSPVCYELAVSELLGHSPASAFCLIKEYWMTDVILNLANPRQGFSV